MTDDVSFFRHIALAMCAVTLALFGAGLAALLARDRGRSRLIYGLLGVVLGPLAPLLLSFLPQLKGVARLPKRFSRFDPRAAAVAVAVGGGTVAAVVTAGYHFAGLRGEALQAFIVAGLIVGGLLSGFVASLVCRRLAYFETLLLDLLILAVLAVLGARVEVAFSYGTTPVFFLVVALAGFLMLEVARIIGGSVGFMLAGDGHLSLHFAYESWIGRRYLMAKRRSSFISVITVISIGGVAVGVWAMLVVLSVMSGFGADLRSKILGANAHMIVLRYGTDFTEYDQVVEKARATTGITGASPFVLNEVMVSSEINLSGAIIKGIVPATIDQVSDLHKNMVQGSLDNLLRPEDIESAALDDPSDPKWKVGDEARGSAAESQPATRPRGVDPELDALDDLAAFDSGDEHSGVLPGIIIGRELARSLKVFLGDPVNVVSPMGELGPSGPVPKAKIFRVAGIFYSGMYEYDAKFVYIRLDVAQDFFTTKGAVTGVEIKVDDIEGTRAISRRLLDAIGGYPYRTKDWKEMNRNLFSALKLEKIAMFIILTFIILVASFNILSTLIMVVLDKGKEISILKSMGATDSSIMKIFVTYGLIIGAVGTSVGVALGYVTCLAIRRFGVGLDPEVYYIAQLPVRMNPSEFIAVAVSALLVSYLATIYPSLQAARLNPVDGLRYD